MLRLAPQKLTSTASLSLIYCSLSFLHLRLNEGENVNHADGLKVGYICSYYTKNTAKNGDSILIFKNYYLTPQESCSCH